MPNSDGPAEIGEAIVNHWWVPVTKLVIHVFVGFTIFLVIGSAAIILDLIIQRLNGFIESTVIISGLFVISVRLSQS